MKFIISILFFVGICLNLNSFADVLNDSFNNIEISGQVRYRYEYTKKKELKNKKYNYKNTTSITIN